MLFLFLFTGQKKVRKGLKHVKPPTIFFLVIFLRYCPPLLSKKSHGIGKAEKKNSLPEVMVEYCMLYMLLFQAHKPLTHSLGLFKNAKIMW